MCLSWRSDVWLRRYFHFSRRPSQKLVCINSVGIEGLRIIKIKKKFTVANLHNKRPRDAMSRCCQEGCCWIFNYVQCTQIFFSQTLFDFDCFDFWLVSHSISPKFSGKIPYRPISSQPFSAGCHGNRNWRPIWKVAWWARVSCRRSRMYGIRCTLVQFCPVIPYSTASFFLPEPVSCRGQRIARSNGRRNQSFTKNITTFAAVVEVLILIAMFFFFFFFFQVLQFEAFVCTTRCQDTSTKMYLAYRVLPKKNGYHFMKNCNSSTHQAAHKKISLTLIMCIDMHFHSIFFSLLLILPNTPHWFCGALTKSTK